MGTRVVLRSENGGKKDYLLLRIIPVESVRKMWVFPVEYMSAEIGMITKSGAYVIPSNSMKSLSFSEFILGYNLVDDYGKLDDMLRQLSSTQNGILEYKDSKGQDCYWYYSSFGEESGVDIVGYIPVKNLDTYTTNWFIIFMTCGVLLLLALVDGVYICHMNRRLRENAKMAEEASKAKTQFLSTMSHDIRTPMNGIIGMTNIAKNHINEPEYVKSCLNKVSLASDHLLTLINDVLDISKVESGSMILNPAVFSLEESIEKLTDIVQVQMESKNLRFETEKEISEVYLIADELRLNQIFINILTNALKYTPQGGTIKMSVREEMVENGKVRLIYCVSDTGMGMTKEFQENMYHMFSREADSRTDKIQGTGLGLAIVKQMVDLMGGTIQCESEPNKGTTFTVTIDMEKGDAEEYRQKYGTDDGQADQFGDLRVLVAEDNDLNWEISCELLKSIGVSCVRAQDGQECIDLLEASEKNPYDLVLMDVQMPVMNGKEAEFQPSLDTEESVTLEIAGVMGNFEALDQVINDFNEYYPNVTVSYEQNDIYALAEYMKNNSYVDIFMTSDANVRSKDQENLYVYDHCLDLAEVLDTSAIDPELVKACMIDGKLARIPLAKLMCGLVVNKTLLENEGLEIPQNYEEFLTVCETLKSEGYTPIQSARNHACSDLILPMAMSILGNDDELKEMVQKNDPAYAESLVPVYEKLEEILQKGYISNEVNEKYPEDNYNGSIMNFFEGDVPFWVTTTESFSGMKKREAKSENFSAAPFEYEFIDAPLGDEGVFDYEEPWYGFSVNKDSEDVDYAVEFMKFLTQEEELNKLAEIKGMPSVTVNNQDERFANALYPEKEEGRYVLNGEMDVSVTSGICDSANQLGHGELGSVDDVVEMIKGRVTEAE